MCWCGIISTNFNLFIFIYKENIMSKEMRKQINKVKNFKHFLNEDKHYEIDDKLKFLKSYIHILKNSDDYVEKINLSGDDVNAKSINIDTAINYFIIIHNFLIIERMFIDIVTKSNKNINKHLQLSRLHNENDVMDLFFKLYDNNSLVRFAIETFDSIEEVKLYLQKHKNVYNTLM